MFFHEVSDHVPSGRRGLYQVSKITCNSLHVKLLSMWLNVQIFGSPSGMPDTERAVLQEQLIDIILEVLKGNPQLHYYQGYHDVAVSLLLVVGERMAIAMLDTLSNFHLRLYFFS